VLGVCGDALDDRGGRFGGERSPAGAGPQVGHAAVASAGRRGTEWASEVMYLGVCLRRLPVMLDRETVREPAREASAVGASQDCPVVSPLE